MRKYINKESVLDIVTDCDMSRDEVADCIEAIPSFDVAPVRHGKWEYISPSVTLNSCYMCTACGDVRFERYANTYNYCPNCGAKMDGGDTDA